MSCDQSAPIQLTSGSDRDYVFQITEDGAPLNLTGITVRLYVAMSPTKPNLLVKSTEDSDQAEITDANAGKVKFKFLPADTTVSSGGLKSGAYVYDVWIQTESGRHYPACSPSPFVVSDGVGR